MAKSKAYRIRIGGELLEMLQEAAEAHDLSSSEIIGKAIRLADLIGKFSPCWLVWDKNTSGGFADCELAYTSFDTAVRKFNYPWNGMIQGFHGIKSKNEKRIHPTQKPVALYTWMLQNYAKPGWKIIDTHLGSGSIAIACQEMGFDLDACEIDAEYFRGAKERLEEHRQQLKFEFTEEPIEQKLF